MTTNYILIQTQVWTMSNNNSSLSSSPLSPPLKESKPPLPYSIIKKVVQHKTITAEVETVEKVYTDNID